MNEERTARSTAMDITNHIIAVCSNREAPIPVSNIKLQKLLYLVFGYYYIDRGEKLFDEPFEAWRYGPVVASVYDRFCTFAGSDICLIDPPPELPKDITEAINPTIETNMRREVFDLVEETHESGSAWSKAKERADDDKSHPRISLDDIIEEFRKRRGGDGGASTL